MSRCLTLLLFLTALAGCERPDEGARARTVASRALRGVLAYPQSSVVSMSAGDDAAELVLSAPAPVGDVVAWYRRTLELNGWELKGVRQRFDTVTIYAERGRQPVWIRLQPNAAGAGTTYTLVGAIIADPARADSGR